VLEAQTQAAGDGGAAAVHLDRPHHIAAPKSQQMLVRRQHLQRCELLHGMSSWY